MDAVDAAVGAVAVARQRGARALGALGPRTSGSHVGLTRGAQLDASRLTVMWWLLLIFD